MPGRLSISEHIAPIMAAIRTVPIPAKLGAEPPVPIVPFVTISREVGAGAWTLAQKLADKLNGAVPGEQPWTCWDRELVEKVAADHHISQRLIESLEERSHSWMGDFLSSLSFSDDPAHADEMKVFGGVAKSIRALALAGRVIIVGRGGVFLTRRMPGGVHVRLVAPLDKRVEHMMEHLNAPREEATRQVHELTRLREGFFKRHWPAERIRPELFTITINTAHVSHDAIIEVITTLVKDVIAQPPRTG